MKKLYIYCDGGFGNRYGTLLGGIAFAETHNLVPVINWRNTKWCRLGFNDIFDSNLEVIEEKTLNHFNDCIRLMHENTDGISMHRNINSLSSINDIEIDMERDYVYNNNWIPRWLTPDNLVRVAKELKFNSDIVSRSKKFIKEYTIDQDVVGVHLRATDFNTYIPKFEEEYSWIQQQPDTRFFVLSDDPTIEGKFNELENVIIRNKDFYVEKVNQESSWIQNVERTSESVFDALIDLTVFSHTNILINSLSTFLKTALIFKSKEDLANPQDYQQYFYL